MTRRGLRNTDLEAALAEAFRLREEELDSEEAELPSEEVLAVMTGAATSTEAARVLRVLAESEHLHESIIEATEHPLPSIAPRRSWNLWMIATAACVLLGFLAWLLSVDTSNGVLARTEAALERSDFEAADRLWSSAPENGETWSLHGGLLRSRESLVVDFDLIEPFGLALSRTPEIRWTAPADCGPWRLRLMTHDNTILIDVRTDQTDLDWPERVDPLVRGESYRIVLDDVSRHYPGQAAVFTVLAPADAATLTAELASVENDVEPLTVRHFLRARTLAYRGVYGLAGRELVELTGLLGPQSSNSLKRFLTAAAAPELARRIRVDR